MVRAAAPVEVAGFDPVLERSTYPERKRHALAADGEAAAGGDTRPRRRGSIPGTLPAGVRCLHNGLLVVIDTGQPKGDNARTVTVTSRRGPRSFIEPGHTGAVVEGRATLTRRRAGWATASASEGRPRQRSPQALTPHRGADANTRTGWKLVLYWRGFGSTVSLTKEAWATR